MHVINEHNAGSKFMRMHMRIYADMMRSNERNERGAHVIIDLTYYALLSRIIRPCHHRISYLDWDIYEARLLF